MADSDVRKARELAHRAESWDNFETWDMSVDERVARAHADAALAQVHATLALVEAVEHLTGADS